MIDDKLFARRLIADFERDRKAGRHCARKSSRLLDELRRIEGWARGGFDEGHAVQAASRSKLSWFWEAVQRHNSAVVSTFPRGSTDRYALGGPRAFSGLAVATAEVLDLLFVAIHGDLAMCVAAWLANVEASAYMLRGIVTPDTLFSAGIETLDALTLKWRAAEGDAALRSVARARNTARTWLAQWSGSPDEIRPEQGLKSAVPPWPPPSGETCDGAFIGFGVHSFAADRLKRLELLLANHTVAVVLSGGSYAWGGRKPPSVSHGTTLCVDLDIVGRNLEKAPKQAAVSSLCRDTRLLQSLKKGGFNTSDGLGILMAIASVTDRTWSSHFDTPLWGPVVTLTQALVFTLPTNIFFGDPFAIAAAHGGVSELIDELRFSSDSEHQTAADALSIALGSLQYDPQVHYNHWHVDWFPPGIKAQTRNGHLPFGDQGLLSGVAPENGEVHPLKGKGNDSMVKRFRFPAYFSNEGCGDLGDLDRVKRVWDLYAVPGFTREEGPEHPPLGKPMNADWLLEWASRRWCKKMETPAEVC